jgi:GTP cyclohydrolase I/GTP cyclohydrolase-4
LPQDAFVSARQENLETIHQHNVLAEREGTIGELRAELELALEPVGRTTSLRDWLDA